MSEKSFRQDSSGERLQGSKQSSRGPREGLSPGQQLQAAAGNQRVMRAMGVRPKLRVGQVNDAAEADADRVADAVTKSESTCKGECGPESCSTCRAATVMAKSSSQASASPTGVARDIGLGTGRPLDGGTRGFFEDRMRADFSAVRIHDSEPGSRAADRLDARAFTVGKDIAFARAAFAPQNQEGRRLLAHELAHVKQNDGFIRRAPNTSSLDDNASFQPDAEPDARQNNEPQESSLYGPAKRVDLPAFDPCAVNVKGLSNYELLAELNAALAHVELGEESEAFFDWRNLGRRVQAEIERRARAGHVWMQSARGEIPATLIRVTDNPIDGSMLVERVAGSMDAGDGADLHYSPLLTEEQFQQLLDRQKIETIGLDEYRRRTLETQLAEFSTAAVAGGRLYNTPLDQNIIDPFSRPSLSATGRPIQKWMGRLGEAAYESTGSSAFGLGVNDLNVNTWVDRRGRTHQPTEENFPVFDFENAPAFARVLGTARISVKTSGQPFQDARLEYYRGGMAQMFESAGRSGLSTYIANQPQFAGQPTSGPQYEANRSIVLEDAYIAVNKDDAGPLRDLLSNPGVSETPGGPALWDDIGFQTGQRPRASWRAVYEGVMREMPIRINGVEYRSPDALDQARQTGQVNAHDYEEGRRVVGEQAASRVLAHSATTLDLVNLRNARAGLNGIPDAQLPGLLTPEYMRSTRAGGGFGGEFDAAGGAGIQGGAAGSVIAVLTDAGAMIFDSNQHPDWERELGTAGTLGFLGGTTGSMTEQALISGGTGYLLNDAAAGGGSLLTRGMVTTGGRFGGGGVGAGVVEAVSMGFFEDRSHSGLEYTERTTRAFVIGGTSAVIGAEVGAGAGVFTTALVGAAAGTEVPVVGNVIGFLVGLAVGAFVYHEADKVTPGGRADWDAAEAARQEGCQPRPPPPSAADLNAERPFRCFANDTQVCMADGSNVSVQDVKVGDAVLGFDVAVGRTVAARVIRTIHHGRSPVVLIRLADGAPLRVTAEHPVAVCVGSTIEWVAAGKLRSGQNAMVVNQSNLVAAAQAIVAIESAVAECDVYDLMVDPIHNLFADRILAHNKMI